MAHPLSSALRPNALITGMAVKYAQNKKDVARVPGVVPVNKQSDLFRVWDPADTFRPEMERRAPGTKAAEAEQRVSTSPYFADWWSLRRLLPRVKINDYGSLREAEEEISGYFVEQSYLTRAAEWARNFMRTGVWTANTEQTGVAAAPGANQFLQWNDPSADPIDDVLTQRDVVRRRCGMYPNTFGCDADVFRVFSRHPDVLEITKYNGGVDAPAIVVAKALATILLVDEVFVLDAAENSAAEGQAAVMADVVSTNCALLGHFTDKLMGQGAAKIFSHQEFGGFPKDVPVIKKWYDEDTDSFIYEAEMYFGMEITSEASAVFFETAAA